MEKYLEKIHDLLDYLQEITVSLTVDPEFQEIRDQSTNFERYVLARNIAAEMYPKYDPMDPTDFSEKVKKDMLWYLDNIPFKPSYQIVE